MICLPACDNRGRDGIPTTIDALKAALAAERAARQRGRGARRRRRGDGRASQAADRQAAARPVRASSERGRNCSTSWSCSSRKLEASAAEDEVAAAPADGTTVRPFTRKKPVRAPLPAHLPRERVVFPAPTSVPVLRRQAGQARRDDHRDAGSGPAQWKVIQTVREKFTCRACETITQPPAPFHPIAARPRRAEPAGDDPLWQVRRAPAAEPAERELCPRGHRSRRLDAGRSGSAPAPPRWRRWSS